MELKIERLRIPKGRRVLAVSDLHGRADWLDRLLTEAGFSDGDELFILGDLIEKGPDSLGCLRSSPSGKTSTSSWETATRPGWMC